MCGADMWALGELTFDTSGVCLGAAEGECEVKTLVQAAALQGTMVLRSPYAVSRTHPTRHHVPI